MPYKEKEITKLYYSIGEVSKMLNVNPSLIRFWEKSFGLVQPKKDRKGNRQFMLDEIETLKRIHHLVKEKGFTLAGAKEDMVKNRHNQQEKQRILRSLLEIKSFLLEIKNRI